jgi:hypothetical protein
VTVDGENEAVPTVPGRPVTLGVTVPVKPFMPVTATV